MEWAPLLAKQIPSPLLPSVQEGGIPGDEDASGGNSAKRGAGGAATNENGGHGELDVFAYPSILASSSGDPLSSRRSSLGPLIPRVVSMGGLDGWDYVAGAGEGRGERLWRHIRSRIDQLARLQGLSRAQFLTCLLLKLAGASSNRIGEAADEAPSDEIPTVA